jgi:hypothetical protein
MSAPSIATDTDVLIAGAGPAISELCKVTGFPLHSFAWQDAMHTAGLFRNAVYLVRPDGYVGFADRGANAAMLREYLEQWKLRPRSAP